MKWTVIVLLAGLGLVAGCTEKAQDVLAFDDQDGVTDGGEVPLATASFWPRFGRDRNRHERRYDHRERSRREHERRRREERQRREREERERRRRDCPPVPPACR